MGIQNIISLINVDKELLEEKLLEEDKINLHERIADIADYFFYKHFCVWVFETKNIKKTIDLKEDFLNISPDAFTTNTSSIDELKQLQKDLTHYNSFISRIVNYINICKKRWLVWKDTT